MWCEQFCKSNWISGQINCLYMSSTGELCECTGSVGLIFAWIWSVEAVFHYFFLNMANLRESYKLERILLCSRIYLSRTVIESVETLRAIPALNCLLNKNNHKCVRRLGFDESREIIKHPRHSQGIREQSIIKRKDWETNRLDAFAFPRWLLDRIVLWASSPLPADLRQAFYARQDLSKTKSSCHIHRCKLLSFATAKSGR